MRLHVLRVTQRDLAGVLLVKSTHWISERQQGNMPMAYKGVFDVGDVQTACGRSRSGTLMHGTQDDVDCEECLAELAANRLRAEHGV